MPARSCLTYLEIISNVQKVAKTRKSPKNSMHSNSERAVSSPSFYTSMQTQTFFFFWTI